MILLKTFPTWETIAENLKISLKFSEATIKRTKSTYSVFVRDYCTSQNCDVETILRNGIDQVNKAYENGVISKSKMLMLRKLAYRMIQFVETGSISWKRVPAYGKKYGNGYNESLLSLFLEHERREHKHAETIIIRDKNFIRQHILFIEEKRWHIKEMDAKRMIKFLVCMKKQRPAGMKSATSALKHFYLFLIDMEIVEENILLAIKPWDTPHKRIYGIFTMAEKERLLGAIDNSNDIGKRDKAIIMLAIDCGLRSSDICHLKLTEIDWRSSSLHIVQQKTQKQLSIPYSREAVDAMADYILNARGQSELSYVFLKRSYCDSPMTSSLLCGRLKKYMEKSGINRLKSEKISMHTFRRSLGTALIDSGESLEMTAQILGHKDKESTKSYISVSEKMLRACSIDMPTLTRKQEGVL